MLSKFVFYSPAGALPIIGLGEFAETIPRRYVDHSVVRVPKFENHNVTTRTVRAKKVFSYTEGVLAYIEKAKEDSIRLFKIEEFLKLLEKKRPKMQTKDFTDNDLNDLSVRYMEEFGGNGRVVLAKLEDGTRTVSIVDDDCFELFLSEQQPKKKKELKGALVALRPNRWVVAHYTGDFKVGKSFY